MSFDGMPPKPDELVVMSWAGGWGKGLLEAVSQPFEALTGIRIRHATNIGLKLPANLIESLDQQRSPPFDIGMGELIRKGELDICFRALTNAIAFKDEGLAVSWVAPKEGITDTADDFWIPNGLPDDIVFWSQRYIDFALSLEVQERWCDKPGVMPVHREAQPPKALRTGNGVFLKSADDLSGVLHIPDIVKM